MRGKAFFIALIALVVWEASAYAQGNPPAAISASPTSGTLLRETPVITEEAVWDQLKELKDGMTQLSVVDLGVIYSIKVENNNVHVVVTLYDRGFIQIFDLASPVRQKILAMKGVGDVTVEFVRKPAWTPGRLSQKAREALGFEAGDPVEGRLHVRSKTKADPDAKPYDERKLERGRLVIPADAWGVVDKLPSGRLLNWRGEWHFFKRFEVEERDSLARRGEPIQVEVAFDGKQVHDLSREIRLVEETSEKEIPCQVFGQEQQGSAKRGTIVFLADVGAREKKGYLLLYGNSSPAVQTPSYSTDLVTRGEGYALEIENSYYWVRLSPVMGQLKNFKFKRWGDKQWGTTSVGTGVESPSTSIIDSSNDPWKTLLYITWHGEDSCVHWGPDFSNQFRFRITLWPEPPHYTVVKGPICTIVKRWGYPVTAIYPALPQTAVMIEVTYIFYSGLPYFTVESRVNVEEEVDIQAVRNDEWLFLEPTFTHVISMMEGGPVEISQAEGSQAEWISFEQNPALVGFYNKSNGDGFASLRLSYDARGFPGAYGPNNTSITPDYRPWKSQDWVRYAFRGNHAIQPGATIGEYNAYLLYNVGEKGGHDQVKDWYNLLRRPLKPSLPERSQ